jgi:peptidoglycan/LPS O-acetylase OafA/YrhL
MWYWNRIPQLDCYIIYFLSSMVLGSLLAWTLQGRLPKWLIVLYALSMIASLIVDYRPRLVVALVTAAIIAIGLTSFSAIRIPRCLVWLGRISYSLFLIHYLVNGLVLYAVNPWIGDSPVRALLAETFAFACSLVAAIGLYYAVEVPTHRWLKKVQRRSVDDPAAAPQRSSVTASQVGLPSVAS